MDRTVVRVIVGVGLIDVSDVPLSLNDYAPGLVWMCHYAKGQLLFIVCLPEQEASPAFNTVAIIHWPRLVKRLPPAPLTHTHTSSL